MSGPKVNGGYDCRWHKHAELSFWYSLSRREAYLWRCSCTIGYLAHLLREEKIYNKGKAMVEIASINIHFPGSTFLPKDTYMTRGGRLYYVERLR